MAGHGLREWLAFSAPILAISGMPLGLLGPLFGLPATLGFGITAMGFLILFFVEDEPYQDSVEDGEADGRKGDD